MQPVSVIVGVPIIRERLAYVLDFLENHPLCPDGVRFVISPLSGKNAIEIFYGLEEHDTPFFIPARQHYFLKKNGELDPRFGNSTPSFRDGNFGFDLFETIFFHISRYEEVFAQAHQKDAHERMRSDEMFLVKSGLEKQPVVDRLVFQFFEKLGLNPQSRPTEFHLSHDVDMLLKFPSGKKVVKAFANMILKQRNPLGFLKLAKQYFLFFIKKRRDPYDTFDWLFRAVKFTSKIVYILSEGTIPKIEKHFRLDDPQVSQLLDLAKSRGYQIGLHPSYRAGFDESIFKKEKEKLAKITRSRPTRTRQHFLRWDFSKTPQIIEAAGSETDSTLGFSDRIGFRCGTGFAYRLYNFEEERPYHFFELPMTVMDVALLREPGNFEAVLKDFLKENSTDTAITFNFHNSSFDEVYPGAKRLKTLYLQFVKNEF